MTFECWVANPRVAKRFRFFGKTLSPDFTLPPSTLSISSYKYNYISLITMCGLTSLSVNVSVWNFSLVQIFMIFKASFTLLITYMQKFQQARWMRARQFILNSAESWNFCNCTIWDRQLVEHSNCHKNFWEVRVVEFTRVYVFSAFLFYCCFSGYVNVTLKFANQFSPIFLTVSMFAESVCELPLIQKCGEIELEKK